MVVTQTRVVGEFTEIISDIVAIAVIARCSVTMSLHVNGAKRKIERNKRPGADRSTDGDVYSCCIDVYRIKK